MANKLILVTFFVLSALLSLAQKKDILIHAYYVGCQNADSFAIEKLSHIIFSFGHLKGNQLSIDDAKDSAMIQKLVSFKSRNPNLKVMLSLGGWGGCATCSDVFATKRGRKEFARSVKLVNDYFQTSADKCVFDKLDRLRFANARADDDLFEFRVRVEVQKYQSAQLQFFRRDLRHFAHQFFLVYFYEVLNLFVIFYDTAS